MEMNKKMFENRVPEAGPTRRRRYEKVKDVFVSLGDELKTLLAIAFMSVLVAFIAGVALNLFLFFFSTGSMSVVDHMVNAVFVAIGWSPYVAGVLLLGFVLRKIFG